MPTPSSIPPDYATQEGETRFNAAQRLFDTTRVAGVVIPETVMTVFTAGVIKRGQLNTETQGGSGIAISPSRSRTVHVWNLDGTWMKRLIR